jgi:L-fucose isomerase-like protein
MERPKASFASQIIGYVSEGVFADDPLHTFGGRGVEMPRMQELLCYICEKGFEHHVGANFLTQPLRLRKLHWHRSGRIRVIYSGLRSCWFLIKSSATRR